MSEIVLYDDKTRVDIAQQYAISGNYSKVARDNDIPRTTILGWAKDSDVWAEALVIARHEITDELLAQNLQIATKANEGVLDRIENGDTKVVNSKDANGKYHETIKVPMTGKDMAVVGGIMQDKGRVAMGMATSIQGKSAGLDELAQRFAKIEQDHNNINKSVVSVQDKDGDKT